jgi:Crinkler effector protein N-terminal domain
MSTSIVTLNCLLYEDKPDLLHIFSVNIDPGETIIVLREKIWEIISKRHAVSRTELDLYAPKTPIPTASKAEFHDIFQKLNLKMPGRRDSVLEELNPTFDVEEYHSLKDAVKKRLHIIIFFAAGRCR